jgi:hypothetical protein
MKKLQALFFAFVCITAVSCRHHHGNIDINYHESDKYYSMDAYFNKNQTREVDDYMDRRIGRKSNMSFANSRIDGTITLDDHTIFYIKKSPGVLKIKLDKDRNSNESYHEIKSMCIGIKKVLAK